MIDWILGLWANQWIAFGLYWMPLAFCTVGYTLRTARNFAKDRRDRVTGSFYHPTDKIGTLIGRGLVTAMPVGNVFAAAFDLAPEVFGRFFRWIDRLFDQPLVPDLPNGPELRQARRGEGTAKVVRTPVQM